MSAQNTLRAGENCWRIEKARRFATIIDGQDYFRAVKQAITRAKCQVLMIGWDFDTRIQLEPDGQTIEGPNVLGKFLNWIIAEHPDVDLKLLQWDLGMSESLKRGETPLFILDWMARRDIDIKLDSAHPPAASHHQKMIVIDDSLAFCGGIDITKNRWDTREHRDGDPARHSASGELLGPWHDATTCVDGPAAKALGDVARMRWKRATGDDIPVPDIDDDPWPDNLEPRFRDVDVAIARTLGAFDDYEQVSEIEALTFDVIANVRDHLYVESQYFASRRIAEAIADRLSEEDGPEIVVVNPQSQDGWLEEKTMGAARAKLVHMVRKADRHGRFAIFHPVTTGRNPIYVHAKIMVADDRLVKFGSANINNRSMGFDTECDVAIEATSGDDDLRWKIVGVRDDLLSEHLGVEIAAFREKFGETGSLIAAIEAFRGEGRGLSRLEIRETGAADEAMGENDLLDPERPVNLVDRMKDWIKIG